MIRAIQLLFGLAAILGGGALLWFRPGAENGLFDLANKDGLWMAVAGLILGLFGLMLLLMGVSSRAKVSKINRYQPPVPKAFPDPSSPLDEDEAILRKTPAPSDDAPSDDAPEIREQSADDQMPNGQLGGAAAVAATAGLAAAAGAVARNLDESNSDAPVPDTETEPQLAETPADPMEEIAQHMDADLNEADIEQIADSVAPAEASELAASDNIVNLTDESVEETIAEEPVEQEIPSADVAPIADDEPAVDQLQETETLSEATAPVETPETAEIPAIESIENPPPAQEEALAADDDDHSAEAMFGADAVAEMEAAVETTLDTQTTPLAEDAPLISKSDAPVTEYTVAEALDATEPEIDAPTLDVPSEPQETVEFEAPEFAETAPEQIETSVESLDVQPLEEAAPISPTEETPAVVPAETPYTTEVVETQPAVEETAAIETPEIEAPETEDWPTAAPFENPVEEIEVTEITPETAETTTAQEEEAAPVAETPETELPVEHETPDVQQVTQDVVASERQAETVLDTVEPPIEEMQVAVEPNLVAESTKPAEEHVELDLSGVNQTAETASVDTSVETDVSAQSPETVAETVGRDVNETDGLKLGALAGAAGAAAAAAAAASSDDQDARREEESAPEVSAELNAEPAPDALQTAATLTVTADETVESSTETFVAESVESAPAAIETVESETPSDEKLDIPPPSVDASVSGEAPLASQKISNDLTTDIAADQTPITEGAPASATGDVDFAAEFPILAPVCEALAKSDLDEADRELARIRRELIAQGDENTSELAALTALAGDHAKAAGRIGGAKWLWRLALQRFQESGEENHLLTGAVNARLESVG